MENPLEHWREVISRQKPRKISGAFWYRSVYRTRRKSILNMDGALLHGGRYNPADEFGALYLSESPEACAAEMRRRPGTPTDYLVGEVAVNVHKICDLTDPALLDQLGLDVDGLCSDDWEITRILGNLIRDSGFEGMVVPSAAGPYKNLVLFLDRFASRSSLDLIEIQPLRINDD
jgi:RES domain-containing protein